MTVCLVGLGSNLGDREQNLDRAVAAVGETAGIDVDAVSRYRATAPIGGPQGQGEFLNAVMRLRTSLSPENLMQHLLGVEDRLGRRRTQRWGPRIIDLDILLFGEERRRTPNLQIPHPRMAFRRFVLEPAAEIAPDMVHPEMDWTIAQLLEHLDTAAPYVAVAGLPRAGKTRLAAKAADRCGARLVADPLAEDDRESEQLGGPDDSTLHQRVLELRAERLCFGRATDVKGESISDFWVEQTRAYAETCLSDGELVRYRGLHENAVRQVPPPKLLVLLEISPRESLARLAASGSAAKGWTDRRIEILRQQLENLATASPRQPWLRVSAETPSQAVDDVVAAD